MIYIRAPSAVSAAVEEQRWEHRHSLIMLSELIHRSLTVLSVFLPISTLPYDSPSSPPTSFHPSTPGWHQGLLEELQRKRRCFGTRTRGTEKTLRGEAMAPFSSWCWQQRGIPFAEEKNSGGILGMAQRTAPAVAALGLCRLLGAVQGIRTAAQKPFCQRCPHGTAAAGRMGKGSDFISETEKFPLFLQQ